MNLMHGRTILLLIWNVYSISIVLFNINDYIKEEKKKQKTKDKMCRDDSRGVLVTLGLCIVTSSVEIRNFIVELQMEVIKI